MNDFAVHDYRLQRIGCETMICDIFEEQVNLVGESYLTAQTVHKIEPIGLCRKTISVSRCMALAEFVLAS